MKLAARAVLLAMVLLAVFADALAGDAPIAMSAQGDLHLFEDAPEKIAAADWLLWPPIRFDPRNVRSSGKLEVLAAPSREHLLGTDDRGRDVAARWIHGARLSLLLALACAALATILGTLLALSSRAHPAIDAVLITLCDVVAGIPVLLVVLVARGLIGAESLWSLIVLISVPRAASTTRIVREALRSALLQPYCEAARAMGSSPMRLLVRHALPQSFSQIRVAAGLTASTAVLAEVALSFLGLGVSGATWGDLLSQAHHNQLAYWLLLPGGIATALLAWSLGEVARESRDRSGGA